ncbi:MAG: putative rhomboid family rane protein, partial [Actinomycetota bacterium]
DREAYVRCQRCERFICPECQVEASVGFLCPDDAGGTPQQVNRQRVRANRFSAPRLTLALIVINVIFWLLEISPVGDYVISYLAYKPVFTAVAPWQMITAAFLHDWSSPLHLLFNMYTLYIFGQVLEPMLGKARFFALYLISAFGGSVAVLLFGDPASTVVGASGAIFGMMGAYFILLRAIGQQSGQLMGLIAINLVFSFLNQGISWQAHIGGLIVGGAVAGIYAATRKAEQKGMQITGLAILIAVLVGLSFYQAGVYGLL